MIDVIYLNGGKGVRVGLGYPKQFARIGGKPIMIYGLEVLNKMDEIGNIIIPSSDEDRTFELLEKYNIDNWKLLCGGETRQESVYRALKYINTEAVLICEAVRPFMSTQFITEIIESYGNVVPYTKLNSTPFDYINSDILNRNRIVMVQTPQKYITNQLFKSHELAEKQGLKNSTDDLDLMKRIGLYGNYNFIEGKEENIKITTPLDLHIAEAILKYRAGDKIE